MSRFECIESFHLPLNDIEGVPSEYLKDSVWDSPEFACKELSENERLDLLNNIERVQAGLQRREPLTVELEDLPKEALGYQDEYNKKIVLNRSCVMTDHPYYHRQTIDTVVHEGRHAYQHYNVEVRTVHESDAEVASWRENFFNPEYGYYQPRGQKI